jgi:hypothetical protein
LLILLKKECGDFTESPQYFTFSVPRSIESNLQ